MKKVFLDTDIIFDMFLERHPFYLNSMLVFEMGSEKKVELHVSSVSFTNLFYIIRKKFSLNQTITFLRKLSRAANILPVDSGIIINSIDSGFNDFEDAVQYYTAKSHDMQYILTRNIKDYTVEDISVMTAEEFIKIS